MLSVSDHMRNQWPDQLLRHVTKCCGEGEGPNFGNVHTQTREWLNRFCSNFARLLCSMHPKRRRVAGQWSRDYMLCVESDDIFDSPVRSLIQAPARFLL